MLEAFRHIRQEKGKKPTDSAAFQARAELVVSSRDRVNKEQAEERRKRNEEKRRDVLKNQFFGIGREYFYRRIEIGLTDIRYIQGEWRNASALLRREQDITQAELLYTLSNGMNLKEGKVDPAYRAFATINMIIDPLGNLRHSFSPAKLSSPSVIFLDAFSDLSNYSPVQRTRFKDFVYEGSGLTGNVKLPQLMPTVVQWLNKRS